MRIHSSKNVYEAALDRIRWLFDEFEEVIVNVSGGKDSTVVFELALIVAREKNRLPLKTLFVDQEAEWQATINQIKYHMYHEDVDPYWLQIPFKLFNATSTSEHWLECWDASKKDLWMHEQDPISLKENVYKQDRFVGLFKKVLAHHFSNKKTCNLVGVRAEESPARALGLTNALTYKHVTWGKILNKAKEHYDFYPIYDWTYSDVWKAIHDNSWPYNEIYNAQYQYGINPLNMRVSNVHHETAVSNLFYMQEVEPQTYQKLTQRISGVQTAAKAGLLNYFPTKLPSMFKDWFEYRDYLLENLITREDWKQIFIKEFKRLDDTYKADIGDSLAKTCITSILTNDWELIKIKNYESSPKIYMIRKKKQGKHVW